jgi:predicted DNA-binding protein
MSTIEVNKNTNIILVYFRINLRFKDRPTNLIVMTAKKSESIIREIIEKDKKLKVS